MINLIIGRPGGGKSYEAVVYHILPAIRKGRKVVTNLPLNIDHFVKVFGDEVRGLIKLIDSELSDYGNVNRPFSQPEHYQDDWKNDDGVGVLVVVDEAHMVLPTGRAPVEVLEFLSLHRHYGIDVTLITQSDRKLHKDVRDMVQLVYRCSKNTALGSDKTYTQKVQDGCRGEVVNTNQRRYKDTYFPFYTSHTASNEAVKEATASDVKPIWKHWSFIGSGLMLCFVLFMVLSGAVKNPLASPEPVPEMEPAKPAQHQEASTAVVTGSPSLSSPASPEPSVSSPKRSERHPLSDFALYVTGYARQLALTEQSTFDLELSFDRIYLTAYRDNLKRFELTSDDLRRMGYQISKRADCVYSLSYEGFESIVSCNESRDIEVSSPVSMMSL